MRFGFILSLALPLSLAACGGSDNDEASELEIPDLNDANSGASAEARTLFARYIEEEGEDFEGCFGDLPRIDADPANAQFRDGSEMPGSAAVNRVVIAIDASGSMAGRVGGQTKMSAARAAAESFIASLPDNVEVGLLAFGHRGDNTESGRERSCAAVDTIYPLGAVNRDRIANAMQGFEATGWTPLASAINKAGGSFSSSDSPGSQVVYVVSDGEETCGGDPVSAARALNESDVQAVVNIIGFDLKASDRAQLRAVAKAGGGEFVEANTPSELQKMLREAARRRDNNVAMGKTNVRNNTQAGGNAIRTNLAMSKLSTCLSRSWSSEKRGLRDWLKTRDADNDTAREIRALIDQRRDRYRARADEYGRVARQRQQDARDILDADTDRARDEYEEVQRN